jgi:hypothetical protein
MLFADRGIFQVEQNQSLALRQQERFLEELRRVNEIGEQFGLRLSEQGMLELAQARSRALTDHGRVELGASAVRSIVDGFCDSPYLLQEDYETTLTELVDAFYYFKNECGEQLTDDELIQAMRERYDAYDGSVEAVVGTSLEALCRARRFGFEEEEREDENDERDDE